MHSLLIALLPILFNSSAWAEELVPFEMKTAAMCGFAELRLPSDTIVLGAGALRGKDTDFQIDQSGEMATQIEVAVNKPGKAVALILGGQAPTIWNIGWTDKTKIVAVFASGDSRQRVSGLKAGTPIVVSSNNDNGPCNDYSFKRKNFTLDEVYDSFEANFKFGYVTDLKEAKTEQKLSQLLFSRFISGIFSVSDGKVIIGDPLKAGDHLVTSDSTPPRSFIDKHAPLAGQAGLEKAMSDGVIRRATLDDAKVWLMALKKKYEIQKLPPPNLPPDLDNAYVVLSKFTYPPGLNGVTFYIKEGVPQPSGDYGQSKIYDLNSITLECRASSECGRAMQSGKIGAGATTQKMIINSNK